MSSNKKVLYYPGAGWDFEYIEHFKYIDKFILCDTMPSQKHYAKKHDGYKKQERFLDHLRELYGEPIAVNIRLNLNVYKLEDGREIHYFHNTNSEIFPIPRDVTDILIRGYMPSWYDENLNLISLYNLWHSCDTAYNCSKNPLICFCKETECQFSD